MSKAPFTDAQHPRRVLIDTDTGAVERIETHLGERRYTVLTDEPLPAYRPTEREWQWALCRLAGRIGAMGLPETQADLVGWLRDEFEHIERNSEPSDTPLKERAKVILDALAEYKAGK